MTGHCCDQGAVCHPHPCPWHTRSRGTGHSPYDPPLTEELAAMHRVTERFAANLPDGGGLPPLSADALVAIGACPVCAHVRRGAGERPVLDLHCYCRESHSS